MTEAQLRKRHGWSKSSKMPSRYVHMINQDVEDAILRHHGIKKDKKEIVNELPIKCVICEMHNPPLTKNCTRCGKALDTKTAIEMEEKEREEKEFFKQRMDNIEQQIQEMKKEAAKSREETIRKTHKNWEFVN